MKYGLHQAQTPGTFTDDGVPLLNAEYHREKRARAFAAQKAQTIVAERNRFVLEPRTRQYQLPLSFKDASP